MLANGGGRGHEDETIAYLMFTDTFIYRLKHNEQQLQKVYMSPVPIIFVVLDWHSIRFYPSMSIYRMFHFCRLFDI